MRGIDLTKELKNEHQEKWVALDRKKHKVLAVGETPIEAGDTAEAAGHSDYVLFFVPRFDRALIPTGF